MSIRIATGIALREDRILLVASRYANHAEPLWTLPGGRQEPGELACETLVREVREETGLDIRIGDLAYASESYDREVHVSNFTFAMSADGQPCAPTGRDHIVDAAWVPIAEIRDRIRVAVVREPLLAYLSGSQRRYFGFHEAGVTIQWFS